MQGVEQADGEEGLDAASSPAPTEPQTPMDVDKASIYRYTPWLCWPPDKALVNPHLNYFQKGNAAAVSLRCCRGLCALLMKLWSKHYHV